MSQRNENIPSKRKQVLPHFHHRVHWLDVEQVLLRKKGEFLLRRIRHSGIETLAVSVRWGGGVRNFPLERVEGRYAFESQSFKTVRELIEWHMETGTELTLASGARIERPVERQPWELLRRQLNVGKQVGKGNFGCVLQATLSRAHKAKEIVAIKTLTKLTDQPAAMIERARCEMLSEARAMRAVSGHPNIVEVFGVTIDEQLPFVVMELVRGESLEKLLRKEAVPMCVKKRLTHEAASGLAYIHTKGYIHRDVAARNCLVEVDESTIGTLKIIDFGMTRRAGPNGQFHLDSVKQMPVAWSAFETLVNFDWSAESDWWSWGCLAWEIFSDGCVPYNDMNDCGRDNLILHIRAGNTLEVPSTMPSSIAVVMKKCWNIDRSKRPKADEILEATK